MAVEVFENEAIGTEEFEFPFESPIDLRQVDKYHTKTNIFRSEDREDFLRSLEQRSGERTEQRTLSRSANFPSLHAHSASLHAQNRELLNREQHARHFQQHQAMLGQEYRGTIEEMQGMEQPERLEHYRNYLFEQRLRFQEEQAEFRRRRDDLEV